MTAGLSRAAIFPEPEPPDLDGLIAGGRKLAIDGVLDELGVAVVDSGISTDPDKLARQARDSGVDFIAPGTFNGVALGCLKALKREMADAGFDLPVFIGGRLDQIPEASNTSLPVEVGDELVAAGAVVCRGIGDMLARLSEMARENGETPPP